MKRKKVFSLKFLFLFLCILTTIAFILFVLFSKDKKERLFIAVQAGDFEQVKSLLKRGADPNVGHPRIPKQTALNVALAQQNTPIIELLLKYKANPNKEVFPYKFPSLIGALKGTFFEFDRRLSWEQQQEAFLKKELLLVRLLLEHGANPNVQDEDQESALFLALREYPRIPPHSNTVLQQHSKTVVELLIKSGADVNTRCEKNSSTPLIWVVSSDFWATSSGSEKLVKLLIENGADIHARNNYGNTALLCAVLKGDERIVKLLIESGADINTKDKDGNTALSLALKGGKENIINWFQKAETPPEKK